MNDNRLDLPEQPGCLEVLVYMLIVSCIAYTIITLLRSNV